MAAGSATVSEASPAWASTVRRVGTKPGARANACTLGYSVPSSPDARPRNLVTIFVADMDTGLTKRDKLDETVYSVLRDVCIAASRNSQLRADRGDRYEVALCLLQRGDCSAREEAPMSEM